MKDVLPPLDRFDYEKLASSILHDGVKEPIVVDEHGVIIDGENRKEIATRFDMPCPERVVTGLTPPEMRDLCIILNAARRQLTIEQRRAVWQGHRAEVKHLLAEQPTRSDRSIADQLGIDHKTVAADRAALESSGEFPTTEYQPGYGGGTRIEAEPKTINNADHRNELAFDLQIHYPCETEDIRRRGDDPYPQESERLTWHSGRTSLIADAARSRADQDAIVAEIAERVGRQLHSRPMKTVLMALR